MSACGECRYYRAHIDEETGSCRRFPPEVAVDVEDNMVWEFPTVFAEEWCGEFWPVDENKG